MSRSYARRGAGPAPTGPGLSRLRLITYLAPGIPLSFFEAVRGYLEEVLGVPTSLVSEPRYSAPPRGEPDPFSCDEADLGFLCAPGYFWLTECERPRVQLLAAAPCFRDPRACDHAVYYSDLVVQRARPATGLADLRGGTWAYNDPCSLSGYFAVLEELQRRGMGEGFFGRTLRAGSHSEALRLVAEGGADCAAIDSNVLAFRSLAQDPHVEAVRTIASFGPHPIQPLVLRTELARHAPTIARALLAMHEHPPWSGELDRHLVTRFVGVLPGHYAAERRALARVEGRLRNCSLA